MTTNYIIIGGGLAYGAALIAATFMRTAFTDAIRIDALFTRQPTPATRALNLVAGVALIAYETYALFR